LEEKGYLRDEDLKLLILQEHDLIEKVFEKGKYHKDEA
jgi:hypothetical protein